MTMTETDRTWDVGDDYLDLRDVQEWADAAVSMAQAHNAGEHTTSWDGCPVCDDEAGDLLTNIKDLALQFGSDLDDAARNEPTMIRESAFVDYAEELASDIGAIDRDASWPLTHSGQR